MISLIKVSDTATCVCVDGYSFNIEKGQVQHNNLSRIGSDIKGQLATYLEAFELAKFCFENQIFDEILER